MCSLFSTFFVLRGWSSSLFNFFFKICIFRIVFRHCNISRQTAYRDSLQFYLKKKNYSNEFHNSEHLTKQIWRNCSPVAQGPPAAAGSAALTLPKSRQDERLGAAEWGLGTHCLTQTLYYHAYLLPKELLIKIKQD